MTDVQQGSVIIAEVQWRKKYCLRSLWSGDIWSTKNLCVFGDGVFTGSSCLFLCNLNSQWSPTVVLVPAWQKLEGYFKNVLAKQMGTSLFFATPRTKDVERRPCPTNTHTFTLFSFSFHGRFSPQISFCDPHPTVFVLSFSFFFWIQTGFEAKSWVRIPLKPRKHFSGLLCDCLNRNHNCVVVFIQRWPLGTKWQKYEFENCIKSCSSSLVCSLPWTS